MPLSTFAHSFIEIPVSDRTPGVKQKARWLNMTPSQDPDTGEVSIKAWVLVNPYAADDTAPDGYGAPLRGNGIDPYKVVLIADNNTAVDATTGEVLFVRSTENHDEWQAKLQDDPRQLLLQGDFFELLIAYSPIAIGELLENFMRQADAPPFSKFSGTPAA